jgi:hypothetical protein
MVTLENWLKGCTPSLRGAKLCRNINGLDFPSHRRGDEVCLGHRKIIGAFSGSCLKEIKSDQSL